MTKTNYSYGFWPADRWHIDDDARGILCSYCGSTNQVRPVSCMHINYICAECDPKEGYPTTTPTSPVSDKYMKESGFGQWIEDFQKKMGCNQGES